MADTLFGREFNYAVNRECCSLTGYDSFEAWEKDVHGHAEERDAFRRARPGRGRRRRTVERLRRYRAGLSATNTACVPQWILPICAISRFPFTACGRDTMQTGMPSSRWSRQPMRRSPTSIGPSIRLMYGQEGRHLRRLQADEVCGGNRPDFQSGQAVHGHHGEDDMKKFSESKLRRSSRASTTCSPSAP